MIAEVIGNATGVELGLGLVILGMVIAFVRRETTAGHTIQSLTKAGEAQVLCNQQQQQFNASVNLRLDRLERPEREETSVRAGRTGRFSTVEEHDR